MVGPFAPLAATKVIIFASGLMIYIPPVQTQVSQWTKSSPKALNTFMYRVRQSFPESSGFQYSERTIASTETNITSAESP